MIFLTILMVSGGLLLLLGGGEVLLRGAVGFAQRLGLSQLLVGLTVVSAATSMPELLVAVASALEGAPDIGVGNVVGSNIANILLILGVAALICPMDSHHGQVTRDGIAMCGATVLFIVLAFIGPIGRISGAALLATLVFYIAYCYQNERRRRNRRKDHDDDPVPQVCISIPMATLLIAVGIALLVAGSKLLVDGAVDLARTAGVSEAVIGLTLIAVGTSLPELATAIVAGYRKHPEVALGNALGSNVFNILAIIGALALLIPVQVAPEILYFDFWVMGGVALLIMVLLWARIRIGRVVGFVFLAAYALYIFLLYDGGGALRMSAGL